MPNPRKTKEHCQSFIIKKNRKSAKQSEIITYQPKAFQNQNIVDIKSVITKYQKTSHKLSKAIRQTEKVGFNSFGTKKSENLLNEKNVKITKQAYAFVGYASSYNVEILNSFNP